MGLEHQYERDDLMLHNKFSVVVVWISTDRLGRNWPFAFFNCLNEFLENSLLAVHGVQLLCLKNLQKY